MTQVQTQNGSFMAVLSGSCAALLSLFSIVGVVSGLAVAGALTRWMSSLLYESESAGSSHLPECLRGADPRRGGRELRPLAAGNKSGPG